MTQPARPSFTREAAPWLAMLVGIVLFLVFGPTADASPAKTDRNPMPEAMITNAEVPSVDLDPRRAETMYSIPPCRIFDSREEDGAFKARTVRMRGSFGSFHPDAMRCTIPSSAVAVAVTMTVIDPTERSWVVAFPGGGVPESSTVNVLPDDPTTNAYPIIRLAPGFENIWIYFAFGEGNVTLDATAYWLP